MEAIMDREDAGRRRYGRGSRGNRQQNPYDQYGSGRYEDRPREEGSDWNRWYDSEVDDERSMRAPRGRYGEREYGQYDQEVYRRRPSESWPRERMGMGIFSEQGYWSPAQWGAGSATRRLEDFESYGSPDWSDYAHGPDRQTRDYSPSPRPYMRESGMRDYSPQRPAMPDSGQRLFMHHDFEHEFGHGGFVDQGYAGKGPKGYKRTDDRIHEEICERLTHHPGIDASEVDIKVKDGEVTLTGHVHERRAKHWAEDVVDGVSGVKEIHNQLKVERHEKSGRWFGEETERSNGRSDERSTEESRTTKSRSSVGR
jgi:hypothetical protein